MSSFDTYIDRRLSDSIKWGRYAGRDILPLWVADMDFAAPPAVIAALQQRVAHGVFGYPHASAELVESVLAYLETAYSWPVDPEWLIWVPGVVPAMNVACRAQEGGVLTATPVYPGILSAPRHSGRPLATADLVLQDGRWQWDWPAMEAARRRDTRLLLLCHPHNPVGRCWHRDELEAVAAFAAKHDLTVCSDEIHCGLILDPARRHIPFAALSADAAQRSITLMAPSKTYNIPGLGCSFAIIPDPELRRRFRGAMAGIVPEMNALGLVACAAAYRDSEDWRRELIAYLAANRDRVAAALAAIPGIAMAPVEATCLAWIDVRQLGQAQPAAYFEKHGLGLSNGADFGAPGWVRLNFGCPRSTLDEALYRLERACAAA